MATQAQFLANAANAQLSTGPRTPEGKARSARNAATHGLASAVLAIDPADQPAFLALEAALVAECKPAGALEMDAVRQIRDAVWRLRRVRQTILSYARFHDADPLVHTDTEAAMRQLSRYRASAEMLLYRAVNTLRDLQTTRLGRALHLAASEQSTVGPLAAPRTFTRMVVNGQPMNRAAREAFDQLHNITELGWPGSPGFSNSNPSPDSAKIV